MVSRSAALRLAAVVRLTGDGVAARGGGEAASGGDDAVSGGGLTSRWLVVAALRLAAVVGP